MRKARAAAEKAFRNARTKEWKAHRSLKKAVAKAKESQGHVKVYKKEDEHFKMNLKHALADVEERKALKAKALKESRALQRNAASSLKELNAAK